MIDEFIVTYLDHQWGRKLAVAISAISILFSIYNLIYLFHYKQTIDSDIQFNIKSLLNNAAEPQANLNIELFGHYKPNKTQTRFMPVSELDLTLVSIMYSQTAQSYALIKLHEQPAEIYKQDDEILPGIKIDKVLSDKIIINNNGQLEVVKLPKESVDFTFIPVRSGDAT